MASYDLTAILARNLDKHLVFPLLEFLSNKRMYPESDLEKAKIELVQKTNMIDYLIDIWTLHYNKQEPPQEFQDRRNEVVAKLSTLQVGLALLKAVQAAPESLPYRLLVSLGSGPRDFIFQNKDVCLCQSRLEQERW